MGVFSAISGGSILALTSGLGLVSAAVLSYLAARYVSEKLDKRSISLALASSAGTSSSAKPTEGFLKSAYSADDETIKYLAETLRRYGITKWEVKKVINEMSEMPLDPGIAGEYMPEEKTILVDPRKPYFRSTVIHETTHAVRFYEGQTVIDKLPRSVGNELYNAIRIDTEEMMTDYQAYRWFDDYHPSYFKVVEGDDAEWALKRILYKREIEFRYLGWDLDEARYAFETYTDIPLSRKVLSGAFRVFDIVDKAFIPLSVLYSAYLGYKEYRQTGDLVYSLEVAGKNLGFDTAAYYSPELYSRLSVLAGSVVAVDQFGLMINMDTLTRFFPFLAPFTGEISV